MPVSVIMPAFNADRFIEDAIASLLAERDTVALDIIVIDDGSTDETRPILEALARQVPELRLLQNPRKGIAAARNTGLDHLPDDCELVTFLDADDISYPGRIARQRSLLMDDPTIDALYGVMEMFTQQDDSALAPAPGSRTKVIRGPYLQSSMYRRPVFDKVGRFDESFRQGCDSDFVLRVIEQQCRLVLDNGIAAYYRRHDANVTLNVDEVQREFMLASLKWAARNRIANRGPIPRIFADMFLNRTDIEKDFSRVSLAYSVVIPAYNAAPTIGQAIESILAQTISAQEIIVVDDGSSDGTAAIAAALPGPITILAQANRGPGAATTAGFARVATPFVATLDADDLWLPHKIAHQAACFEADSGLAGVFSLARLFADGAPATAEGDGAVRRLWTRTTLLFRSEAAREVGDFIDQPGKLGEVIDWLARSRDLGQRHALVEEVLALRRIRPGSLSYGRDTERSRGYLTAIHATLERRKRMASEAKTGRDSDD